MVNIYIYTHTYGVFDVWYLIPKWYGTITLACQRTLAQDLQRVRAAWAPCCGRTSFARYGSSSTKEQTLLAVRTCFILTVALLRGAFISVEQPGASVMFELECFQRLLSLGCWITKFAFCNYGSAFNKPSKWLHNKPWLSQLWGSCQCSFHGAHFVIEGSFTKASIRVFKSRCLQCVRA